MLRTNTIFNKKVTNNIVFQDAHFKIQTSFLSSCPAWIILMVSGLLLTQASPLSAMEDPEITQKSKSTRAQPTVLETKFYKDAKHPLTQDFLKEHDLSKRLKKIQPYVLEIKEKISNDEINKIKFNETDLKEILKFLECKGELKATLRGVLHLELLIDSYELRPISGGRSGNALSIASWRGKNLLAIKTFENKEKGLEELLRSLVALALNPCPEQLKMARIYDAFLCPKNDLSIIMEAAKGQELQQFLSKDSSKDVIDALAEYLATFHIENYCKNVYNIDGKAFINHASEPYHTLHLNLLTKEEKEGLDLLDLSIGTRVLEPDEKVTSSNIIKLLKTTKEQIQFKKLVNKICETFEENCGYILRIEKPYLRTRTHGDAQKDNFLYNDSDDIKDENGSELRKDSCRRVTMIDFESIGKTIGKIGDPAEDVGRFVGSLWDLAVQSNNLECADYTEISKLQEQFIGTYLDEIRNSHIFSSKEDKKTFENIFKENCNFYKLRFYRAVFNTEKDKTLKLQILKSWIKENAHLESSPDENTVRDPSQNRDWKKVNGHTHGYLPDDQSKEFIESAAPGSDKSYLTLLWEELHHTGRVTLSSSATIAGMGGIGKTSLALEYAHQTVNIKAYNFVYWIPSGTELSLLKGYRKLLLEMGIPDSEIKSKDDENIIRRVKQEVGMSKRGKCLLIYDNVPSATFLEDMIPENNNTHILITSRCSEGWGKPALNLDVFSPEDSTRYLLNVTGLKKIPENEKVTGELAEQLGHFPLALAHAAHYLKLVAGQNVSAEHFRNYLKALTEEIKKDSLIHFEEKRNLFKEPESEITYENLINRTLRISSGRLSDLAKKLMEYSAYLDSDAIAEAIFLESSISKKQVEEALTQLSSLSLIKRVHNEPLFSIHRLVQLVVRNENELKDDKKAQEIFSFMTSAFKILFEKNIKTAEKIDKLLTYFPHLIEFISHSQRLKIFSDDFQCIRQIGDILYFIELENIAEVYSKFDISSEIPPEDIKYINKKSYKMMIKSHILLSDFINSYDLPNWIIQIAEQSHPRILYILALIYEDKQLYWMTKAAKGGYARAQDSLGVFYRLGKNVEKNYAKAVKWLTKAAEQGYSKAQFDLAALYHDGEVIKENYEKAVKWLSKSAKQGYVTAQFALGKLYCEGQVVEKNYEKALKWLTRAAEQENADAQLMLGRMYYNGHGVKQNYEEAVTWYMKAGNQGGSEAQLSLGLMYYAGQGVERNYEKAIQWLTKVAEQGNADAQLILGRMYYTGQEVETNYEKAIQWLIKAAEQGKADAQLILGIMYYTGQGVEQSYQEAMVWFSMGAAQVPAKIQYSLGKICEKGEGVAQSYSKAADWYRKAAEQGDVKAQYRLKNVEQLKKEEEENLQKEIQLAYEASSGGTQEEEEPSFWTRWFWENQEEEQPSFWTRWFWGNQEEEEPSYWTRWFLGK